MGNIHFARFEWDQCDRLDSKAAIQGSWIDGAGTFNVAGSQRASSVCYKSPRSASFFAIGVNCDLYLATVTAELYYSGWAPKRRVRLTQAAEKCFWANPDYLAAASISPDSGFSNPREHL